jgi:hypothetical protein
VLWFSIVSYSRQKGWRLEPKWNTPKFHRNTDRHDHLILFTAGGRRIRKLSLFPVRRLGQHA